MLLFLRVLQLAQLAQDWWQLAWQRPCHALRRLQFCWPAWLRIFDLPHLMRQCLTLQRLLRLLFEAT